MKNVLFFILLFSIFRVAAQENIEVRMTKLAIHSSMQPAFVVDIPQTNSKDAIKMWEDRLVPRNLLSAFKRLPVMEKEDKDKWQIHGVVIDEVSPDTLSIYTRISSYKDRITFAALFEAENGFIGSDTTINEPIQRASAYLRGFAVELYRQAVQDELDGLEKDLKKMEKDYDGYGKDNRKLDRKTEESQSNLNSLDGIDVQGPTSGGVLSEDQIKEKKKEEKALKRYSKQMDKNKNKQKKLAKEIDNKKDEIKDVEKKLRKIK